MYTLPALTPVTTPVALTEAIYGAPLLHVPPGVASVHVAVAPTQRVVVDSTIGDAAESTVNVRIEVSNP